MTNDLITLGTTFKRQ